MTTKWEYFIVSISSSLNYGEVMEKLDEYGKERWELISVDNIRYTFKRPLRDEPRGWISHCEAGRPMTVTASQTVMVKHAKTGQIFGPTQACSILWRIVSAYKIVD